ncbi:hypothetical protein [Paenibacillus sp. HW567]|uniref:hypothetical protein n=1 Tax=Paenibacillus sp. HW567 TaxID=1034769 RepID=UPI000381C615|nr:hypothetical protein [Paenibacillus sp. HW567]
MDNDLGQLLRSVIREELVPVNERLDRIETEQQNMKQDQKKILEDQNNMIVDQELIKRAVLETNERVVNIESLLENQHTIIELLSARSIEQEAKLKRIK